MRIKTTWKQQRETLTMLINHYTKLIESARNIQDRDKELKLMAVQAVLIDSLAMAKNLHQVGSTSGQIPAYHNTLFPEE